MTKDTWSKHQEQDKLSLLNENPTSAVVLDTDQATFSRYKQQIE